MKLTILAAFAGVLVCGLPGAVAPAGAGDCYDILGCTDRDDFSRGWGYLVSEDDGPTCEFLWTMRNSIFAEHGYCFSTPRGRATFSGPCRTSDMNRLGLSRIERANIETISRAERVRGCSR